MKAPFPLPNIVIKDVRATHARDVLRHITDALELAEGVQAPDLMKVLMDAEMTGGSAIGDGVAVVSARASALVVPRRLCAFAQLTRPVAFRGVDQHPCDLVFVMVSPDTETQSHLRDLSMVIRTLRDRDFVDRLRVAPNSERTSNLFHAREMAMSRAA